MLAPGRVCELSHIVWYWVAGPPLLNATLGMSLNVSVPLSLKGNFMNPDSLDCCKNKGVNVHEPFWIMSEIW